MPRGSIAEDDPLALAQRRVWEAQKIVAEQKGGSLGFALPEPERPTPCKRWQPLSPICACSWSIATP
jgi:hypothetical protein